MGATTLNVKETSGFSKGDRISISSGGVSEQKRIVDLGSIILDQPLEHDFPKGAKVSKLRGEAASAKDDEVGVEEEEAPSDVDPNNYGPKPITFYVYRASGDVHYPLENVNVGDLAGVMWYLHNEIVPAPVRKYGIDRIRRYKVRMRPVVEFWNVHHTYFGPFMAYDAAKCTTPMGKQVYDQYGYILGCQPVTPGRSAYEADEETLTPEACSAPDLGCRSPVWYSLPGACPLKKLRPTDVEYTQKIHGVTEKLGHTLIASSDDDAKSDTCIASEPGGRCDNPTGAPDCAYSVEDAGEVLLDELVGIKPNFNDWFQNITVTREYDEKTDKGIGVSFWDGRQDKDKCQARLHSAQVMFEQKFGRDNDLTEGQPVCDFDSWYDQEFTWKRNHTGAMKPTRGFSWESHATV